MKRSYLTLVVLVSASVVVGAAACQSGTPTSPTAAGGAAAATNAALAVKQGQGANGSAVCHVTGNGSYNLLNVNENAVQAHLGHGDGIPGDGQFDDNCDPVPVSACPCFSRSDLDAVDWTAGPLQCFAEEVPEALSYASIELTDLSGNVTHLFVLTGEGGGDENFANSCSVQDETSSVETGIHADSVPACFGLLAAKIQDLGC